MRTPYLLLLSFPGINVVSAAEFAGEMGPIANSPSDTAITGRAGLYPSRYQSDQVDHTGPLVRRANRALRYVLLLIAENLLKCNDHFRGLDEVWQAAGVSRRAAWCAPPSGSAGSPTRWWPAGRCSAIRAVGSGTISL